MMLGLITILLTAAALAGLLVCLWRLDQLYSDSEQANEALCHQLERHKHLVEGLQDELDKTDDIEVSVERIRRALGRLG